MTSPGEHRSTTRVLLVDDVVAVRRLLRTALRFRGGFEVVGEASTGAEAVELTGELDPDVVVLDLGLPDLTGRDVLTAVRERSDRVKIVIFSGAEHDDRGWFEERSQGFVLKDAELDYLVDLLESVSRSEGGAEASIDLPRDLASVRDARQFVSERLAEWELNALRDDAFVVVSELAANAITHAGSDYRVRLALAPRVLRIEVYDGGRGMPEPRHRSEAGEGGRGLMMVAALSASWGTEWTEDRQKVVWAELSRL